jgi:hypothetical protein
MQHPRFNLAAIGFSAEQRILIKAQLDAHTSAILAEADHDDQGSRAVWQLSHYDEAHALLLNQESAYWSEAHDLRFHAGDDASGVLAIVPDQLRIPFAVSGQSQLALGTAVPHVMLHDPHSLAQMLAYFCRNLQTLCTLYALAYEVNERQQELDATHVYHLGSETALDAIVDIPMQRVMLRPGLEVNDIALAIWSSRPASANSPPVDFVSWTWQELDWVRTLYGKSLSLPDRYFVKMIHLRRLPRVRASMFYPRHNRLFELLNQQCWKFLDLAAAVGYDELLLRRDLYALYRCQAITTTLRKLPTKVDQIASSQSLESKPTGPTDSQPRPGFMTIAADLH